MVAHPRVVAALYAQLDSWRMALREGATRVGWKLAYEIPEIDEVTGGQPVLGYITSATVIEPGGTYAGATRTLRAETELAIAVGDDGVAGLGVALELVDVARPPHDLEGIVAANVFHRGVAFGRIHRDVREATPTSRDPVAATAMAAAFLEAAGERLLAGDLILGGGMTHEPVTAGDTVEAAIDGLGAVALEIAA